MKWNKDNIIAALTKLVGDKGVITEEKDPEGEYYCRAIYIQPSSRSSDGISITGFRDDIQHSLSDVDKPDEDIDLVEICNYQSDSDRGLSKTAKPNIRELYYIAVDYFNKKKISIVDNLKDHF
jgi:hypothetical protein